MLQVGDGHAGHGQPLAKRVRGSHELLGKKHKELHKDKGQDKDKGQHKDKGLLMKFPP